MISVIVLACELRNWNLGRLEIAPKGRCGSSNRMRNKFSEWHNRANNEQFRTTKNRATHLSIYGGANIVRETGVTSTRPRHKHLGIRTIRALPY